MNLIKDINIVGLHWIERWRVNNGKHQSYVIPFSQQPILLILFITVKANLNIGSMAFILASKIHSPF